MSTSGGGAEEQGGGGAGGQGSFAPPHIFTSGPSHLRSSSPPHTLVLGLGNPILGDDGVGWWVVEAAQEAWQRRTDERQTADDEFKWSMVDRQSPLVEFDCVALGGLALMERLIGYDRAVLVDAIQTRGGEPGAIYRLTLDDLPTLHADAIHDASLKAALTVGQQLGARLPKEIVVIGIEAVNLWDFSESLSPQVAASVGRAAEIVLDELVSKGAADSQS
jgi:hydrogenase maturation protease